MKRWLAVGVLLLMSGCGVVVGQSNVIGTPAPTEMPAPTPTETPVPTPVGGHDGVIALSVDFFNDLNPDLYTLDLICVTAQGGCTRGNLERVTDIPGFVVFPAYAPDGEQLAFSSEEVLGGQYLFTMALDGSEPQQVIPQTGSSPSWSPDGEWLVFASDQGADDALEMHDIYRVLADGSRLFELVDDPDSRDDWPTWSPDGGLIAFASNRDGDYDIYTMTASGSRITRLTDNDTDDVSPAWSPDGERLAYAAFDADGDSGQLRVMRRDGSEDASLTGGAGIDNMPAWSPDGAVIAFWSTREDGGLFLVDVDSGEVTTVLLLPGSLGPIGLLGPVAWK